MLEKLKKYSSRFFIFGNISRPILPFKVNLLYWRPKKGDNVGDYISKIVYRWCLNKFNLSEYSLKTKRISVIGSVLSFVGGGKTTIWGSGLMSDVSVQAIVNPDKKVRLDIRAVRGPKTAAVLRENGFTFDETYGDPAILMPLIYSTKVPKQKGKVVIIPHESRYRDYADRYANVLNTYTRDYKRFIDEIASAEKVISSSLHGIILAESYGTPAVFLNDYPGARFKYEDYYASTGREVFPMGDTVEEAERISGEINPVLKEMQAKLLSTFPTDIFHKRN